MGPAVGRAGRVRLLCAGCDDRLQQHRPRRHAQSFPHSEHLRTNCLFAGARARYRCELLRPARAMGPARRYLPSRCAWSGCRELSAHDMRDGAIAMVERQRRILRTCSVVASCAVRSRRQCKGDLPVLSGAGASTMPPAMQMVEDAALLVRAETRFRTYFRDAALMTTGPRRCSWNARGPKL